MLYVDGVSENIVEIPKPWNLSNSYIFLNFVAVRLFVSDDALFLNWDLHALAFICILFYTI